MNGAIDSRERLKSLLAKQRSKQADKARVDDLRWDLSSKRADAERALHAAEERLSEIRSMQTGAMVDAAMGRSASSPPDIEGAEHDVAQARRDYNCAEAYCAEVRGRSENYQKDLDGLQFAITSAARDLVQQSPELAAMVDGAKQAEVTILRAVREIQGLQHSGVRVALSGGLLAALVGYFNSNGALVKMNFAPVDSSEWSVALRNLTESGDALLPGQTTKRQGIFQGRR